MSKVYPESTAPDVDPADVATAPDADIDPVATARTVLSLFTLALSESGARRARSMYAAKRAGVLALAGLYGIPNVGGTRVGVKIQTVGRNGIKSTSRESVPVVDAIEAVVMGGAAIRSGKIVGSE